MQRTVEKVFFALIRFEIKGEDLCEDVKNLITPEMLPALFNLSKRQDLAHLIGDALDKNGLLPDGTEERKRFLQERNMALYRYEQIQYEFEQICAALKKAKIPFIPLKGSVIRQYYPEPWMRTSCDIDILVKEETLESVAKLLCDELDYTANKQRSVNELSVYSPSGVHVELHYDLTEGDKYGKDVLSNIGEYLQPAQGEQCCLELTDTAFYFYHIAHMVKHFENGGCGVRPFLDLWLLNNHINFNTEERITLLCNGGFLKFAEASEVLSSIWFDDEQEDELSLDFAEYVLTGGVYGTMQNRVAVKTNTKQGKFRYLCSRIFLPYRELKFKYPRLQKWPILFPFYQVKRWFRLLKKDSRERSVRELKETTHGDAEKQQRVAKLLKDLDL